jgi:hypothetical protein
VEHFGGFKLAKFDHESGSGCEGLVKGLSGSSSTGMFSL